MTSANLHPEELLDKAAAGTLTAPERAWLDAHLAQCAVCRLESQLKADFAAAMAPGGEVNVDDVVARALAGLPSREQPRRRAGRGFGALTAAAVMFFAMASFAAAGHFTGVLPRLIEKLVSPAPAPAKVPVAPPRRAPPPPVEQVEEETEPPPAAVVVVPEPEAPPPAPRPKPVLKPAPPAPEPVVVAPLDAAELFAEANAARTRGDLAAAALRYRDLLSRFPSSDEARLSRVVFGRMLLDRGDPVAALALFDAYLASGDGALREEAMAARARALKVQGRSADEAAAWRALAAEFPDSLHARHATPEAH